MAHLFVNKKKEGLNMPITFSEQFNVASSVLENSGAFDVILDVDTRVFIDPALLELCTEPEFVDARSKVERYFSNIITLLQHSKQRDDMYWKRADRLLTFKELSGTCFGYSQNGTGGNAIGTVLRYTILNTIKELMIEGETDPVLFELLGVFQEGIGCDRVSDLITFILREDILKYTQRVVTTAGIATITVVFGRHRYLTCENPYNKKPLLLLPAAILSPLPIADSFDDIDQICQENERVRQEINAYFDLGKKNKLHKSQILSLMHNNLSFRSALVSAYKALPKNPYDFSSDPAGEYVWLVTARKYVSEYPLTLSNLPLKTTDDVLSVARTICDRFKTLIEDNGLAKLLYDSNGSPKHESAAQLLFFGIADSYCNANDIDLTKEGNNGRGPVDFKLSHGANDKVVVETKLTSNPQLRHGIEIQLPIYMKQEKTKQAIYLIIDTGHPRALESFISFYNLLDIEIKKKISYLVIDATSKPSASKA